MAITPAPSMLRDPGHLLSLGFGSGLSPVAPGTFGSVVGIGLYLLVAGLSLPIYLTLVLGLFVAGIPLCQRTATALKTHDHSGIVWDEIVGILVTLAFVPASFTAIFAGFLLFRLFDIWKPMADKMVRSEY